LKVFANPEWNVHLIHKQADVDNARRIVGRHHDQPALINGSLIGAKEDVVSDTQIRWRPVETFLFDTCTYKCSYCHFAEFGKVLDASQLRPYRDPEFIRAVTGFFNRRTSATDRWMLQLTGGEPLLMPNFELFCDTLAEAGNKIALYTAMMVGYNQAAFRYLLERGAGITDYLMVSFHPEAESFEEKFFDMLRLLKQEGHTVICRFVGHPRRLHRLDALSDKCRALDIAFYPTTLFSPEYPTAYTDGERQLLERHMSSAAQVIQLRNGVDTTATLCHAGSALIHVDLRSGNITPCASVGGPSLGNIFDDRLTLKSGPIACPAAGISCICDVHFHYNIVIGTDDSANWKRQKEGWTPPIDVAQVDADLAGRGITYSKATPDMGQTKTASVDLALSKTLVRQRFVENEAFYAAGYRDASHPMFRTRQEKNNAPPGTPDKPPGREASGTLARLTAFVKSLGSHSR
jgi:MoaA/NifB/PqqE/SkfB family radical SAM enzyme